jgi:nicotinamidase/pyrazinamidase
LDAVSLGFKTWVIKDACRGVNLSQGDIDNAWQAMEEAGCRVILSQQAMV